MPPKHDQRKRVTRHGKKKKYKVVTLKQKMDILRRYDRGESTETIRKEVHLSAPTICKVRRDREKIMAAVEAGAGSSLICPLLSQPATLHPQQARTSGHFR